jgi:hypothetical protein
MPQCYTIPKKEILSPNKKPNTRLHEFPKKEIFMPIIFDPINPIIRWLIRGYPDNPMSRFFNPDGIRFLIIRMTD